MIRVVVADDSAFMRKVLSDLFEKTPGFQMVGTARDGREAVKLVAKERPDLLTLDINMPVMDGLTATKEIRSLSRPDAASVPIIALTANAFTENIRKCREAGMNDHIAKPLDINRIYRILAQYITQPEEDSHDES